MLSYLSYCPVVSDDIRQQQMYGAAKYDFIFNVYSLDFTPENLRQAIMYAEIKQPEIVYRQALIETGNFTSDIFRYGKNCYGMKLSKHRCTSAVGEYNYHAMYAHWWDSVMDYRYFQDWYISRGWVIEDYLAFLWGMKYATDKHYIDKLKNTV
jgi:hypothetical protein